MSIKTPYQESTGNEETKVQIVQPHRSAVKERKRTLPAKFRDYEGFDAANALLNLKEPLSQVNFFSRSQNDFYNKIL